MTFVRREGDAAGGRSAADLGSDQRSIGFGDEATMPDALISRHCTQRIAERTSYSLREVQELWDQARTATITDLAAFCTHQRPDTAYRIAVFRGQKVLIVRSLSTGRFVTILLRK